MNIWFRKETKTERAITEAVNSQPPATVAQQIQATRIMGGIGYALFAGFLLTIGYAIFANSKTIRVDGTVVSSSLENSTSYGGTSTGIDSTHYWYELQYTDIDGVTRSGKTFGGGTRTKYSAGDVLSVGYYSDDPSKVRIRNWFAEWRIQIVLLGLGLALIVYSIKAIAIVKQEEADETGQKKI